MQLILKINYRININLSQLFLNNQISVLHILPSINNNILMINNSATYLDYLQNQSHQKLQRILQMPIKIKLKILMVQTLIHTIRQLQQITCTNQFPKIHSNFDQLSTSISDNHSLSLQTQKDFQQLQQRIIKLQQVKFENYDEIETMEEQLSQMDKIVKVKREYDQFLKKKVEDKLTKEQSQSKRQGRGKSHNMLNKGLDKVADILNIDKWWK